MAKKAQKHEDYGDEVAERRAKEALFRALTTPYRPQREMVGKSKRPSPKRAVKSPPKKR
jgi:hypothetical protein